MPRTPPYSQEAEVGVLGSALIDAERVVDLCIQNRLSPESFFVGTHRIIYSSIEQMVNDNLPVDILTVSERLRESKELDKVGGIDAIEAFVDTVATSANAGYYIATVRDKHLLRQLIDKSNQTVEDCYVEQAHAEDVLAKTEERFFEVGESRADGTREWRSLVDDTWKEINLVLDGKKSGQGLTTGYNKLDTTLLGFRPAEMIVLAARPSMGKTALALNVMERIATKNKPNEESHPVAIFSLEMSAESLARRMLCTRARVSSHELGRGICSKEDHVSLMAAADVLRDADIYIDESSDLTPPEMRSRARRMVKQYGIKFIAVDYLQLMRWPEMSHNGRQNEVAAISTAMKAMAKELKIPVMVLSQLSRRPEDRSSGAPKLSDLRDSGAIEQDADVVLMLRRPSRYKDDEEAADERLAIVDVAKNRNGPTGEVRFNFEDRFTRFEDRDEGVTEEPLHYYEDDEEEFPVD